MRRAVLAALAAAGLGAPHPAAADYAAGVAAYQRGDRFRGLDEFRRAGEAGDAKAQFRLGQIYEEGTDVVKDPVIALMWYDLAAAQNMAPASESRGRLAAGMSPDQLARSRALTRQRLAMDEPAEPATPSAATAPTGKIGKEDLILVQERLTALGFDAGKADGKMGKRTRDAIRQYQRANAMPATGEVDNRLIISLQNADSRPAAGQQRTGIR